MGSSIVSWNVDGIARLAAGEAPLTRTLEDLALVAVFQARHPNARAYTWKARGERTLDAARVDFALVSPALVPRVVDTRILEDARGASDHAPISLTLEL
ncbi:MAG: hypothetical protein M3Y87_22790 [Myxococcota bacterium]|nr:hypothetical protein [Myxococcota bacterium]